MKKSPFFLLIFLFPQVGIAQSWVNLNPFDQPPGNTLFSVHFVDSLHGWTVGEGGFILSTSNGGQTWVQLPSGVSEDLYDVDFVNEHTGWACGSNGVILVPEDGNRPWHRQTSNTNVNLNAIDFVDELHGWVVGDNGVILRTRNGGAAWEKQNFPEDITLRDVAFVDTTRGWTVGHYGYKGMIFHTLDGGNNWEKQFEEDNRIYVSMDFLDNLRGWTLSPLKTSDGGLNWVQAGTTFGANDISVISFDTVWAVGSRGRILRTSNGGNYWEELSFGGNLVPDVELRSVQFIDKNRGWIVGQLGTIVHTADGGKTWEVQRQRLSWDTSVGAFRNADEGWMIRRNPGNSLWQTRDGGYSWEIDSSQKPGEAYGDIVFLDEQLGWVYGNRSFLKRTVDGGQSWQTIQLPATLLNAVSVFFLSDSTVFLAMPRMIYRSADAGTTWQQSEIDSVALSYVSRFLRLFFVNSDYGWAMGPNRQATDVGFLLATQDGGKTWQARRPFFGPTEVYMLDHLQGLGLVSTAFEASLFRTEDGWQTGSFVWGGVDMNDVFFVDGQNGWISANYGFLLHTTNGGKTVREIETGTNSDLNRIVFVENGRVGYVFGSDNTLLKYDARPNAVEEEPMPQAFKLGQNYPNPFNPETVIRYQLGSPAEVSLRIYNLRGQLVRTLVAANQSAGDHEIHWDGRDEFGNAVASGVFLYRLQAGEQIAVKKLMLLR
jgi:photosystem II stability/assembly factor-like uncharacterized protein